MRIPRSTRHARTTKALVLCVPSTRTKQRRDAQRPVKESDEETEDDTEPRTSLVYRSRWFVLSLTDGKPYEPVAVEAWWEDRALAGLGVTRIPFGHYDGKAQGYSAARREVAISWVAALPHKTLIHELAHVLLNHHAAKT